MLVEREKKYHNQSNKTVPATAQRDTKTSINSVRVTTVLSAALYECKYGFKNARSNVVFTFALSDLQSLPGFPQKIPRFLPQPLGKKRKKKEKEIVERRTKGKKRKQKWNKKKRKKNESKEKSVANCFFRHFPMAPRAERGHPWGGGYL